MSTDRWHRVETLFFEALEQPPEERTAFLSERCNDEDCRAEVSSLLSNFEEESGFLDDLRENVASSVAVRGGAEGEGGNWRADPLGFEGTEISGYSVQEHIGRGGMGVVYRAWDARLGRSVALKFLPPVLAKSTEANQQFVQEARAAARLEHPNIATIHEIGETEDGRRFIVMPHYDGETLRERMARADHFEPQTAADYARTIARALHRVHEVGLVHQDVKPANVMMTEQGTMKLLDFGLAADATGTRFSSRTRRPGTPEYMSPEQVDGSESGPETDVWALGVMLYEMLTGERPFTAADRADVLRAVQESEPAPIRQSNAAVPRPLARIVSRCLQKEPAGRYSSADSLAQDLAPVTVDAEAPRALAVLPFAPLGEQESGAFTDGMHESILSRLSNVSDLKVTVGTYADERNDEALSSIAKELGARWVLTGGVWRSDDHIQINAQLVDGQTADTVWAETYRRDLTAENLFDVQEQITQSIAEALKAEVTPGEQERLTGPPTRNLEAYRLYTKGRSSLDRRNQEGIVGAVDYFKRAVELDSTYALAWAGLADAMNLFPLFGPDDHDRPEIDGEQAARRALELDPDLAEGHTSLGFLQPIPQGIERLRHAVDLKPSYAQAHQWLALKLLVAGNMEEAYEHASIAAELAPRNRSALGFLAFHNIADGRYRDGLSILEEHSQSFEVEPDWAVEIASRFLFAALYGLGEWEKAQGLVQQRQTAEERPEWVAEWEAKNGVLEAALGNEDAARQKLESLYGRPGGLYRGVLHAALGDQSRAFEAFTSVETWGYYNVVELRYFYPELLGPLRDRPRFDHLIERVEDNIVANPTVTA